jgi:hypothetical protein
MGAERFKTRDFLFLLRDKGLDRLTAALEVFVEGKHEKHAKTQ